MRVHTGVDHGDRHLLERRKREPGLVEAALRQIPLAGDERIGRGESEPPRPQRLDVADAFDPGERRARREIDDESRNRAEELGARSGSALDGRRDPLGIRAALQADRDTAGVGGGGQRERRSDHGNEKKDRGASCAYPTTARTAVTPSAYPPVAGRRARYSPGWRTSARKAPAESTVLLATRLHVEPARRSMKTAAPARRGRTVPVSVFGSTESREQLHARSHLDQDRRRRRRPRLRSGTAAFVPVSRRARRLRSSPAGRARPPSSAIRRGTRRSSAGAGSGRSRSAAAAIRRRRSRAADRVGERRW